MGSLGNLLFMMASQQGASNRQPGPLQMDASRLLLSREQNPAKPSVAPIAAGQASKSAVLGSVIPESNASQTILGSFA